MFVHPNAPYDPKFCNAAGLYRVDVGPKFYIGSTTRLGSRHSSHRADLVAGKHPNTALQAAWDEHQDFRFTVLTLIPEKPCDRGRDHAERLKFHEQKLLDDLFADPDCCNASENSRYNTTISGVMRRKWLDPEYRVAAIRRMRGARKTNPVSPETRERMAAAKRGLAGWAARPCVLQLPGSDIELAFESSTEAARFVGATQQAMHGWLTGKFAWPGSGPRPPKSKNAEQLTGLRGRFVERSEFGRYQRGVPAAPDESVAVDLPRPGRVRKTPKRAGDTACRRGEKHREVELTFAGQPPVRYLSIHAAARAAKTTHLKMFQWLAGERLWPEGLTGRPISPL